MSFLDEMLVMFNLITLCVECDALLFVLKLINAMQFPVLGLIKMVAGTFACAITFTSRSTFLSKVESADDCDPPPPSPATSR